MTTRRPRFVLASLLYEVLQASSMLLFLLSSIATSRRRQYVQPGVAHPIDLPGLPDLCISPSIINVPDDDLYGPCGAAAQMAYKGWIAETYGLWENRWRNELKDALNRAEVRPEMEAFGDLRRIRNDLLHNGTASVKECGKCSILKWFEPGERIVFDTRHVLDFLNQIGVLSLRFAHGDSGSCSLKTYRDRNELLSWSPTPRLVSVRTHNDGKEADPPYKPVTVVFDNGVFANVPFQLDEQRRWTALGYAQIRKDGRLLLFQDGTTLDSDLLYRSAVIAQEPRRPGDGRPRLPVTGPSIRFGRAAGMAAGVSRRRAG